MAYVGKQPHVFLSPAASDQRIGQPLTILLLRQALLGYHSEDFKGKHK